MNQEPLWLSVARSHVGLQEQVGPGSNPVIVQWAKDMGVPYPDDDVAWCALFGNRMLMAAQLPMVATKGDVYNLLRADAFSTYGVALGAQTLGAIMVFRRDGGAHVGFYVGETGTHYAILGGNQKNSVSITLIEKGRCKAIRWVGAVPGTLTQVAWTGGGRVSVNEA